MPYRGGTPAVNDVLGGRVGVMFAAAPTVLPYLRANRLRGLATSDAARSVFAPELPTVAEAGFPEFDVVIWNALFAPAHTPAEIVSRLNGEINGILAQAQLKSTLIDQGAEPRPMDLPSLAQFISEDYARSGRVVRAAGITRTDRREAGRFTRAAGASGSIHADGAPGQSRRTDASRRINPR